MSIESFLTTRPREHFPQFRAQVDVGALLEEHLDDVKVASFQ